jgi:predicted ATPase
VGRDDEVADLASLLTNGSRLVSVTGPGGTGKTRLALQAASELVGRFRDGVFWVPLASIADSALVLPEVARTLGTGDLLAHARDREMLLLLDNLEQLQDVAESVSELLSVAPRCRVLATSRTPLHADGEREYPLGPLAEDSAVVLFCERARAAGREVQPDGVVREICRRLDALPLALELAASRTKLLDPESLLRRLDHRLALLTGGRRDAPQRQRTLRATIEWSHDLLDEPARALFASLAVFAGGATLDSVEQVCEADLDALTSLVDSSLVKVVDESSPRSRFLMLATIREYAVEQLDAQGDADWLRRRHAEHYAEMAQQQWVSRRGTGTAAAAVAVLDAEGANVRAAQQWAHDSREWELSLRLLTGGDVLFLRGSQSQLRDRVVEALQSGAGDERLRGRAYALLSFVQYRLGDMVASDDAANCALELGERSGDRRTVATAYSYLANRPNAEGRVEQARESIRRSLEAWTEIGDERGALVCMVNLVDVSLTAGDHEVARADATVALEAARRFGDPEITEVAAVNAALACLHLGRYDESSAYNDEALGLARGSGDLATVVCCLRVSAALAAQAAELVAAARIAGKMERIRADIELTLEPSEKVLHEQVMQDLAVLGADRLRTEMAAGAKLSLDEVLARSGD